VRTKRAAVGSAPVTREGKSARLTDEAVMREAKRMHVQAEATS